DWSVGQVLAALKEHSIDQNTLVIFTSDNGPAKTNDETGQTPHGSAGHLRGHKFSSYEGGHRVPCIARWPGNISAGTVCNELTTAMDLMPTFASLAHVFAPKGDGHNIWPLLSGDQNAQSPYEYLIHCKGRRFGAIRRGPWKLIAPSGKNFPVTELYNLEEDLGEQNNLAENHPELVKELTDFGKSAFATIKP
ncbi:MAG: sulfatase-like hydrolase/transferase, partial [Planctomycetales bacterium]